MNDDYQVITKPRVRRTPAQLAQANLDAAVARQKRAVEARDRLKDELDAAQRELEAADRYAAYAAAHPDLPKTDG